MDIWLKVVTREINYYLRQAKVERNNIDHQFYNRVLAIIGKQLPRQSLKGLYLITLMISNSIH